METFWCERCQGNIPANEWIHRTCGESSPSCASKDARIKELEEHNKTLRAMEYSSQIINSQLNLRIAKLEKVVEAGGRVIESAKPYKAGGLPLQQKIDEWTKAMDDLRSALAALKEG